MNASFADQKPVYKFYFEFIEIVYHNFTVNWNPGHAYWDVFELRILWNGDSVGSPNWCYSKFKTVTTVYTMPHLAEHVSFSLHSLENSQYKDV